MVMLSFAWFVLDCVWCAKCFALIWRAVRPQVCYPAIWPTCKCWYVSQWPNELRVTVNIWGHGCKALLTILQGICLVLCLSCSNWNCECQRSWTIVICWALSNVKFILYLRILSNAWASTRLLVNTLLLLTSLVFTFFSVFTVYWFICGCIVLIWFGFFLLVSRWRIRCQLHAVGCQTKLTHCGI